MLTRCLPRGEGHTYGSVLDLLGLALLECDAVALVLQALGGDQALDLGGLGVRLLALALGLDLAADDVLPHLLGKGTGRYPALVSFMMFVFSIPERSCLAMFRRNQPPP